MELTPCWRYANRVVMERNLRPIEELAEDSGIPREYLIPYGRHATKVSTALIGEFSGKKDGHLVLVTSMSPTPAGEGKTTLAIGLAQSLKLLGKSTAACLRQPSLGPLFGVKGGATGSGASMVHPAEDISMHFTGDDHAVTTAHNLISSVLDNRVYHGNPFGIDKKSILWRRASSINDRALRRVRVGIKTGAAEREEGFIISAASELMSILCLSTSIGELKERVGRVLLARTVNKEAVTPGDLKITGAVAALLKNALNPNLAQSTEGVPIFVHGGPFGNISLGCNSLVATKLALKLADYVLTEAGFATDLGAEKFFDIKCRVGNLKPSAAVVVATLASLRLHGGAGDYMKPDMDAAIRGLGNLKKHVENVRRFGVPAIVALNRFAGDPEEDLREVIETLANDGVQAHLVDVREMGGRGGTEAAGAIIELCRKESVFRPLYPLDITLEEKLTAIAGEIYGAGGVELTEEAKRDLKGLEEAGYGRLPLCVAKTHMSLSDDPELRGRPSGFNITVRRAYVSAGAGFVVAQCGKVLMMPGFPPNPRAEEIDVDENGEIKGL